MESKTAGINHRQNRVERSGKTGYRRQRQTQYSKTGRVIHLAIIRGGKAEVEVDKHREWVKTRNNT